MDNYVATGCTTDDGWHCHLGTPGDCLDCADYAVQIGGTDEEDFVPPGSADFVAHQEQCVVSEVIMHEVGRLGDET